MRPRDSLILVGDDSRDASVLACLLARATDGSEVVWTDPLIDGLWDTRPGLMVVRGRRSRGEPAAESLAQEAPCPVAVAPFGYAERAPSTLRRIGVGFDGWDESRVALAEAALLAEGAGAELAVLTASDARALAEASALEGLDLLVLGSGRQGPLGRVLPGTVSGDLLRHPPQAPLLVCPRSIAAPLETAPLAAAGAAA